MKKNIKIILIIHLIGQILCCPILVFGQNDHEINTLNNKANAYLNLKQDADSARFYALNSLEISKKKGNIKEEASANLIIGKSFLIKGAQNLKAFSYLIRAKQLYQSINDTVGIANSLTQLSVASWEEKLYHQTIEYNRTAFELVIHKNDFRKAAVSKYLIGLSEIELKKIDSAKIELEQAMLFSSKEKNNYLKSEIELAFANIDFLKSNYELSKKKYYGCLKKLAVENNSDGIDLAKIGIGKCNLFIGNIDSAEIFLVDAYNNSKKRHFNFAITESSKFLVELYKLKNDYKNLSKFQEIYFETKDSVSNQQTAQTVTELLNQVVINDKQSEINSLSTQQKLYKIWMLVLGIVILFGSLVIYLFYKSSKTKQRLNEKLTQSNNELLQSQEQILKLQKYKEGFLANVTHELRTPLNAIKGISDLLQFTNSESEKEELISGLKKSSQHLLNMINDFLDFSKLKEGKLLLRRQPFALQNVIKTSVNLLRVNAEEKGITLNLQLHQIPETVLGDESRLIQILVNILGNAIKFTNKGFVQITASGKYITDRQCEIKFEIKDSGIGIPPEKIKLIFEDYEQVDENITAQFGGTGLGLGICKRLIEQHQGNISCESEVGTGTTFTITLPYEYLNINEIETSNHSVSFDNLASEKINILIADDNAMNLFVAEKLLQKNMPLAKLFKAQNGEEAIEIVSKNKIQLILMDMKMPVMDGLQATQEIRKMKDISQPHIIAMTAGTSEDDIKACFESGMNDYLPKPYQVEVLLSKIQKIIESNT